MSATFKISKKKYTQNDLRRLMQDHKAKTKTAVLESKIDSPLAKYDDSGQLTCVLCKSVVRSEAVWKVHLNTKTHKENVAAAKQLKEKLESAAKQSKRPNELPDTSSIPSKIARSSSDSPTVKSEPTDKQNSIPSDFFDADSSKSYFQITLGKTSIKKELVNIKRERVNDDEVIQRKVAKLELEEGKDEILPEGFFDDPVKDAKVRNLEYKDPQEEEWERFQREIKEQSTLSNAIIAEEREEATAERQIEEIDEQIQKWSKVLDLEKKKEVVSTRIKQRPVKPENEESSSDMSDADEDFEEFLDWRAKRLLA